MKHCLAALLMMASLSACSGYSLQELRHTTPSGNEFNQTLTWRYLDYAEELARRYDWSGSARFADKGLLAAYNNEVGPEDVTAYVDHPDAAIEFAKARGELLALLSDKNINERPAVAAEALFFFDCWLAEQQKPTRSDEASACKQRFDDRIAELADTSFEKVLKEQGELPAVDTTSYMVFFLWGQTEISTEGAAVIDGVAAQLAGTDGYEVVLNGHSDLSGDAKYNLQLSKRRAEAVRARLASAGVKDEAIKVFAFGESDPLIKTKDGVKEPQNRRVEIFLGE